MELDRSPVTTLEELNALDSDEMIEGYRDGRGGDDEPGGNRSKSYWHGWRNGRSDRTGIVDSAGALLAKAVVADLRRRASPLS